MKVYVVLSEEQIEKPLVFNKEKDAYIEACNIAKQAMIDYGQLKEGECMHDVFCDFCKESDNYGQYEKALSIYNEAMPMFETQDMIFVMEAEYKG